MRSKMSENKKVLINQIVTKIMGMFWEVITIHLANQQYL